MERNSHLRINHESKHVHLQISPFGPHSALLLSLYYPHFTDEEMEDKKNKPNSQSYEVIESRSKSKFILSYTSISQTPVIHMPLSQFLSYPRNSYIFLYWSFLKIGSMFYLSKFSFNLAINSMSWFFFSNRHENLNITIF